MEFQGRIRDFQKTDDLCLTFGEFKPGEMPLKQAVIKTETGFEDLTASMVELSGGILLSVQSERCCDTVPKLRQTALMRSRMGRWM